MISDKVTETIDKYYYP